MVWGDHGIPAQARPLQHSGELPHRVLAALRMVTDGLENAVSATSAPVTQSVL